MKATTEAKATAQTALGWRHMGGCSYFGSRMGRQAIQRLSLRVVEERAHDADGVGERLRGRRRRGAPGRGRSTAPRSARTRAKHRDALRGDADQHGPGVGGVGDAGDQAGVLEPADLGGHRRLRAVVERGQVGDAGRALVLDRRQQPGLREGQLQPDALGGQAVEPGHRRTAGPRRAWCRARMAETCRPVYIESLCRSTGRTRGRSSQRAGEVLAVAAGRIEKWPDGSATGDGAPRRARSLQPDELAHAAVMAALCAATAIIAVVVPFAAGLSLLGTVPMGLLAYRYRFRVLIAATVAGGTIAFLIAGCRRLHDGRQLRLHRRADGHRQAPRPRHADGHRRAVVAGARVRRRRRRSRCSCFSRLRHLIFDVDDRQHQRPRRGARTRSPAWKAAAQRLKDDFATLLTYWPVLIIGVSDLQHHDRHADRLVGAVAGAGPAVRRARRAQAGLPSTTTEPVGPVPVTLRDVRFRYPGADHDALGPVSLTVDAGEHVAITGANGSGKTTLMLLLAGRAPTAGTIERPGAVGLGQAGGTAVVLQHPESQVLGTRVADDVVLGTAAGNRDRRRPAARPRSAWTGWTNATPAGCPAASCSDWRWPPRWPASRRC